MTPVAADLSTPVGARAVAEAVTSSGQACAGVVAAAGGLSPRPTAGDVLDDVAGQWQAAFGSNVLTAVLLVEVLMPALREAAGRVVLLSSGAARSTHRPVPHIRHAWRTIELPVLLPLIVPGIGRPTRGG